MNRVIFVIGTPRSGTTFTSRLLGTCQDVLYWEESDFLKKIEQKVFTKKHPAEIEALFKFATFAGSLKPHQYPKAAFNVFHSFLQNGIRPEPELLKYAVLENEELIYKLISYSKYKWGVKNFVEKSPDHAFCTETAVKLFPKCFVLHVVRHPLDTIASLKEFCLSNNLKWNGYEDAITAGYRWNDYYNKSCLKSHGHIQYEKLVFSHLIARQLVEDLGLKWTADTDKIYYGGRNPQSNCFNWHERLSRREIWEASKIIDWENAKKAGYNPW
jgi:hypothetical protein